MTHIYDLSLDLAILSDSITLPAALDEADRLAGFDPLQLVLNPTGRLLNLLDFSKSHLAAVDQSELVAYVRALGFDKCAQIYELT